MDRMSRVVTLVPVVLCLTVAAGAQIPTAGRDALIALYNATDGDNWLDNSGWLGTQGTECGWHGVTCDVDGTTVERWSLNLNHRSGSIPPELGILNSLEGLALVGNELTGTLPSELGNLSNLLGLNLTDSQLSGSIPAQLGDLSNLHDLRLNGNQLSASIPRELEDLSHAAIVWKRVTFMNSVIPIPQGEGSAIFARLFDPTGGAVTQSITVDDGTQGEPDDPAVAANAAGEVVVAWERTGPPGTSDVFARTLDLPKNLAGPEVLVNSDTWRDQREPAVVMNADGEFVVAWQGPSEPDDQGEREPGTDIFARSFDADGTRVQAQFRIKTSVPGAQKELQLVMNPDGDCTAAWASESTDGTTGIFARQISNCDPSPKSMGQEIQVNDVSDGLPTRLPAAAMDDDATVTVVYVEDDVTEGDWGVFGRALSLPRGACSPGPTTLCLNGNRFEVEVDWVAFDGATGPGQAVQLTSDTGYFWFFDSANVELIVKVLDGRAINGRYRVFSGALSNVQYTITVTDTSTGVV